MSTLPPAVNYHINRSCNARCTFCYATFRDVQGQLPLRSAAQLVGALRDAGVQKLNFAGGEPTLHLHIGVLTRQARRLGFTTSIVTNGARLDRLLNEHAADLDWVGLSVDSGREDVEVALGRSRGGYVADSVRLASRARALGIRVKLNTVLTALNRDEDMSDLVRLIGPERWKVFQVLAVTGQNDGVVGPLLISRGDVEAFAARHAHLAAEGFAPIIEDNDAMTGSYAMIDPLGRFFSNATGAHTYSAPILEVGVEAAFAQIAFFPVKFEDRGGVYKW